MLLFIKVKVKYYLWYISGYNIVLENVLDFCLLVLSLEDIFTLACAKELEPVSSVSGKVSDCYLRYKSI